MDATPWTHPLFLESWPRLLAAGGLLIAAWSAAWQAVGRRFGPLPWDLAACAAATWVAIALTAPALVLGAVVWLSDWTWALAVLLAVAALRRSPARADLLRTSRRRPGVGPSAPFVIALGGVLLGRIVYGFRNPPADVDSIVYHLPMVAHWMQSGSLGASLMEPHVNGTYFPGNGEVLQMWAAWALLRDTLMPWTGILGMGLLTLALRQLCYLAGARGSVAEVLALAVGAAPGITQLTLGTRIDVLLAAWFAVGLVFALRLRREGGSPDLAVLLGAAGLLAGTKTLGPFYAVLLFGVAWTGPGAWERARTLWRARAALALAALTGGFWYARNLVGSGNPLFPATLHLGPWTLEGLIPGSLLLGTTQIAMWFDGRPGQLTWTGLASFFGVSLALVALGVGLWAWHGLGPRRSPSRRPLRNPFADAPILAILALACFALFLVTPYSGSSLPAAAGHGPALSADNLRYLLPALVALIPLGAAGLMTLRSPETVTLAGAAIFVAGLWRMWGHVLPGIGIVGAIAAIATLLGGRVGAPRPVALAVGLLAVSAVVALGAAAVEPRRENIADGIWDDLAARLHNLPAARIRELRASAAGRPIACVGVYGWWAYYGRDFSGRPAYLPVATGWNEASRPYRFRPDPRARANHARWFENLIGSNAAFVVVGSGDAACQTWPVEWAWCEADTARFVPRVEHDCPAVYEVRAH